MSAPLMEITPYMQEMGVIDIQPFLTLFDEETGALEMELCVRTTTPLSKQQTKNLGEHMRHNSRAATHAWATVIQSFTRISEVHIQVGLGFYTEMSAEE